TTLQSAIPGNNNYIRVTGVAFDKAGNLWMNNSSVKQPIHCLKADGTWEAYPSSLSMVEMPDKMIVTSNGNIWMNIPYNSSTGLYVFNQESDKYIGSVQTANGSTINVNAYYCLREDKNGDIWVGTNRGVIISPAGSARNVLSGSVYFRQPTRDDNTAYFLDGERVNYIAVDGGNQKWIATETSGVYLVNEDGSETLQHFSTDNSPLLSDKVNSIAINPQNGEVFFGTDKGICSYRGVATEGRADFSEVYAYPNPVRPTDPRQVTITGLMEGSNVKITDLAGNLIYQARSLGGQLQWNCSGVKSGIYLILAATEEGQESVVSKVVIVN
ncbi:MAG: two-component regulator propeller domain-containing protein, partial [Parabacteroides sp.]